MRDRVASSLASCCATGCFWLFGLLRLSSVFFFVAREAVIRALLYNHKLSERVERSNMISPPQNE